MERVGGEVGEEWVERVSGLLLYAWTVVTTVSIVHIWKCNISLCLEPEPDSM